MATSIPARALSEEKTFPPFTSHVGRVGSSQNDFSFGVMPGIVYDKTNGSRHASGIFAAVVGKEWTPRFRSFVEVAAERIAFVA